MSDFRKFLRSKPIIGMIHMPALPGAPRHTMDLEALVGFARKGGDLKLSSGDEAQEQRVGEMLQLIVATREFQRV